MKSPLVDVAAILMCAALVVLIGQYYIHKKQVGVFQVPTKVKESEPRPNLDISKFEVSVKHTE